MAKTTKSKSKVPALKISARTVKAVNNLVKRADKAMSEDEAWTLDSVPVFDSVVRDARKVRGRPFIKARKGLWAKAVKHGLASVEDARKRTFSKRMSQIFKVCLSSRCAKTVGQWRRGKYVGSLQTAYARVLKANGKGKRSGKSKYTTVVLPKAMVERALRKAQNGKVTFRVRAVAGRLVK